MKKVLILGAGMVVKPMVDYLLKNGFYVTIASRTKSKAENILNNRKNGESKQWTVDDEATLDTLVRDHDLTVSFLPYAYHAMAAKMCIRHKKNMVTTSYVQPEMVELDQPAKDAGIVILNEIGVDPGIDHMSAKKIIDQVHQQNGKIEEFYSITGALAAPEVADNPLKYKFSWSPKGVVKAGNNTARYLRDGKEVNIPSKDLFKHTFLVPFPNIGELEVYANRDSINYINIYDTPEAKTMFRGTFRYKGWCETIDVMKQLNLISEEPIDLKGKSYAEMIARLIDADDASNIRQKTARYLGVKEDAHALDALEWLGLFSDEPIGREKDSPFEVTSDLMLEKMKLGDDERDMVAMQHTFLVSYPHKASEVIKSSMLVYGSPDTDTSVARTVAIPAAIAVRLILEGKINLKGVYRPVIPEIYEPVLDELENNGISLQEEFGLPETDNIELPKY
ncbi:MAG: saccharopine dehydrogenase NADP-binding domain-containing protein [Bacteroidales bacterium]|nr:saccharopine dehydrogenase NADP-binding domain-containing protein [Bacteroidales bacterium]